VINAAAFAGSNVTSGEITSQSVFKEDGSSIGTTRVGDLLTRERLLGDTFGFEGDLIFAIHSASK
jgi:hypothetical protein